MEKRRFTAEEKYRILEEGRAVGGSIAEVCRRHQISTALFYYWDKQTKQASMEVLKGNGNGRRKDSKVLHLQEKIQRMRSVISEITEENLTLKKRLVD
ncbi:MAG: transposase [Candidatus Aureabacteria bacterium]|nr:transposase [Candidatus Auribacterota bacterium]